MFFLQSTPNPMFINLFFIAAIFLTMYFFFILPQRKRQKEQDNFMDELKKGDEVVLSSGIIGKINKIDDGVVQIQVDQKSYLRVVRNAISKEMTQLYNKGSEEEK